MKIIRLLVLLMLAGVSMTAGITVRATGDAIPAECATKTHIQPRTPGWAFVMNFDIFEGASPKGCLMLYRVVYAPTDFVPVTCKSVGNVSYGGGRAIFNGGYVFCDVNIKQQLAALTPPAVMTDTDTYPYFTIIAAGTLSASIVSTATNPIAIYKPNTTTVPGLGLYVPLRVAQGPRMISVFNNVPNVSVADISVGKFYTFTVEHDGGPATYTSTHYLDNFISGTFSPRAPVSFYTNGGVFWMGADPANLNDTLRGTMDEVIFDPPDGGRPPLFVQEQILVFAPVTLRQP